MTSRDDTETILTTWFLDTAPATVPVGLHNEILGQARASRQRIGWHARLRVATTQQTSRPAVRASALVLAAIALLIASLLVSGLPASLRRNEMPAVVTPTGPEEPSLAIQALADEPLFDAPFTYATPTDPALERDGTRLPKVIRWSAGDHGVMVASVDPAWGHGNGRVFLAKDPEGFLRDLSDKIGLTVGTIDATTLDGQPAMTATSDGSSTDLHLRSNINGLAGGDGLFLDGHDRLITARVGGSLVLVEIWASSEARLDAWMPDAQRLVDSVHFTAKPSLTSRGASTPPSVDFSRMGYRLPSGSRLRQIGLIDSTAIAFAVRPDEPGEPSADPIVAPAGIYSGSSALSGNTHGVLVASADGAWGYALGERTPLRRTPGGFLADLEGLDGIDLGPTSMSRLDGRVALTARTAYGLARPNRTQLYLDGDMTGFPGPGVDLTAAFQLIVADVNGTTVFVAVWAQDDTDLDAWLPVAHQFVDSLDFDVK